MVQTGEGVKNTQTVHKLRGYLSSAWSVMRISAVPLCSHILTKFSILKCTTLLLWPHLSTVVILPCKLDSFEVMKGKGNISKKLKLYFYYFSLSSTKQNKNCCFFNFYRRVTAILDQPM